VALLTPSNPAARFSSPPHLNGPTAISVARDFPPGCASGLSRAVRGGMAVPFHLTPDVRAGVSGRSLIIRKSVMRPRRYRLRLYVRAVRALLSVLTRIDDWLLARYYPK
jgi:hypothetical protein